MFALWCVISFLTILLGGSGAAWNLKPLQVEGVHSFCGNNFYYLQALQINRDSFQKVLRWEFLQSINLSVIFTSCPLQGYNGTGV